MYFRNFSDIVDFSDEIMYGECYINGELVNKKYKVINLLDLNFLKNSLSLKKDSLLNEYIVLKLNLMPENLQDKYYDKLIKITKALIDSIDLNIDEYEDDAKKLFYELISIKGINCFNLNLLEVLRFIIENNYFMNYIIIYDSSKYKVKEYNNVIMFDVCKSFDMKEYNLLYFSDKLENIYIDVLVDNLYNYWPVVITLKELVFFCNNNFLNIFGKVKVYSFDDKEVILSKFLNDNYNLGIKIKYLNNDITIKSFLIS